MRGLTNWGQNNQAANLWVSLRPESTELVASSRFCSLTCCKLTCDTTIKPHLDLKQILTECETQSTPDGAAPKLCEQFRYLLLRIGRKCPFSWHRWGHHKLQPPPWICLQLWAICFCPGESGEPAFCTPFWSPLRTHLWISRAHCNNLYPSQTAVSSPPAFFKPVL